jgi:Flp pilus assembly protein TadB
MFLQSKRHFVHPASFEAKNKQAEEPEQRQTNAESIGVRHERTRLLVLSVSLLILLCNFLAFLLAHTIVPLFVGMILVFIGYRYLDRYLRSTETFSSKW